MRCATSPSAPATVAVHGGSAGVLVAGAAIVAVPPQPPSPTAASAIAAGAHPDLHGPLTPPEYGGEVAPPVADGATSAGRPRRVRSWLYFFAPGFFLPGFLPFLPCFLPCLTLAGLGFRRSKPDSASGGQPFGRPRSNGPEIACWIRPFSR